jgi:hypothetical protein
MAIPPLAQTDLIAELEEEKPNLVVYDGRHGLNGWDGVPNSVRHHEVSRYLLTHYVPFARVEGELFMKRKQVGLRAAALSGPECDWGSVPAFWSKPLGNPPGRLLTPRESDRGVWQVALADAHESTLHFAMEGSGEIFLSDTLAGTYDPESRMRFRTLPTGGSAVYPLKVGSCYQWYQRRGKGLVIRVAGDARLKSLSISE